MAQYIDKSALVAEFVRKMNHCEKILLELRNHKDYYQGKSEAYKEILSFLDTLEVGQPLMLQSDCVDCPFYDGFGQCTKCGKYQYRNELNLEK